MTELRVPKVGESITEVEIAQWKKVEGDGVALDEEVVVIETDKATVGVPSPSAGAITKILKPKGSKAAVGEVIALIDETLKGATPKGTAKGEGKTEAPKAELAKPEAPRVMPAAAREMAQKGVTPAQVTPTGPGGRILKEDVQRAAAPAPAAPKAAPQGPRQEELVPMTPMRKRIAERLVSANQNAALLTTFNEIDMSAVMALRKEHGEAFQQRYGVKLGFMSFFVKAACDALRLIPELNAEIRGDQIAYRHYCDIGIAVGGGKGLVVPILRNAERMSFAEVEKSIADFGARAKENAIKIEEMTAGTFTISNGGVYGSLLSTPIVNPPQSGILGLHAIQERPVGRAGQIVLRPMMYVALTYDHRLVDGRESVTFLKRIVQAVEEPSRILLEI